MKKRMLVIGLTGGIGMGKSTAANILRAWGLPVYEADKAVHKLLSKNGKAVKPIARLFPASFKRNAIDRKQLGKLVFGQPKLLKKLEAILHPLVKSAEKEFLAKARRQKKAVAILEIPLLFETGGEKRCDAVICVTVPRDMQKKRVMQRPGMTRQKFKAILNRQMPDRQKRKLADFVVKTGGTYADTKKQLHAVLQSLPGKNHA